MKRWVIGVALMLGAAGSACVNGIGPVVDPVADRVSGPQRRPHRRPRPHSRHRSHRDDRERDADAGCGPLGTRRDGDLGGRAVHPHRTKQAGAVRLAWPSESRPGRARRREAGWKRLAVQRPARARADRGSSAPVDFAGRPVTAPRGKVRGRGSTRTRFRPVLPAPRPQPRPADDPPVVTAGASSSRAHASAAEIVRTAALMESECAAPEAKSRSWTPRTGPQSPRSRYGRGSPRYRARALDQHPKHNRARDP